MHLYIQGRLAPIPQLQGHEPAIHFEVHDRQLEKHDIPGASILQREPKPSEKFYHFGRPGTALTVIGEWVKKYLKKNGHQAPLHLHASGFDTGYEEGMKTHLTDYINLIIENARLNEQLEKSKKQKRKSK